LNIRIIDYHPMIRNGVRNVLARLRERHRGSGSGNGDSALRVANALTDLNLILLDLGLPGKRFTPGIKGLNAF
jgi:DNA-binding NarL/FixJ family response regulator